MKPGFDLITRIPSCVAATRIVDGKGVEVKQVSVLMNLHRHNLTQLKNATTRCMKINIHFISFFFRSMVTQ